MGCEHAKITMNRRRKKEGSISVVLRAHGAQGSEMQAGNTLIGSSSVLAAHHRAAKIEMGSELETKARLFAGTQPRKGKTSPTAKTPNHLRQREKDLLLYQA